MARDRHKGRRVPYSNGPEKEIPARRRTGSHLAGRELAAAVHMVDEGSFLSRQVHQLPSMPW